MDKGHSVKALLNYPEFPGCPVVLGDPLQAFPQFTRFVGDIERYMVIKTLISLATGVLCIPLTMTLKFACENNKGTRWIAVLLGPEAPGGSIPPVSKRRRNE